VLFSGVAYAMSGGQAGLMTYAVSGAVQAASSVGSEVIHTAIMAPVDTAKITDAVLTGVIYTAAQFFLRGEQNWLNNYAVSAGAEYGSAIANDYIADMREKAKENQEDENEQWGE
jgi:hypothetical protein